MRITLSPQRRDDTLSVIKAGDVLTINGDAVDLSVIPDGAELTADAIDSAFILDKVERIDGILHVKLFLPHGPDADESVRFPADIVDPPDGPLALPGGA